MPVVFGGSVGVAVVVVSGGVIDAFAVEFLLALVADNEVCVGVAVVVVAAAVVAVEVPFVVAAVGVDEAAEAATAAAAKFCTCSEY